MTQPVADPDMQAPAAPTCWIVTEGIAGTENQCLGLAEALRLAPAVKRIGLRPPWRWLPPRLWPWPLAAISATGDGLQPPWPDILIAGGRKAAAPAAAIRQLSQGRTFTVCVQNPQLSSKCFDAVVAPRHDGLAGANVISIVGALSRVTRARLNEAHARFAGLVTELPHPRVAVLVGGRSKTHAMTPRIAADLADRLKAMAERTGCGLMVTTSRRTGTANAACLRRALANVPHVFHEAGASVGENPYLGFLAHADHIVVTADSVSMASEAASTGRPVHVVELKGGKAKFDHFHHQLRELGIARPFDGTLPHDLAPPPLDETNRAAETLRKLLNARRSHVTASA